MCSSCSFRVIIITFIVFPANILFNTLHAGSPVAVRKLSTQMLKITTLNTTDCEGDGSFKLVISNIHPYIIFLQMLLMEPT